MLVDDGESPSVGAARTSVQPMHVAHATTRAGHARPPGRTPSRRASTRPRCAPGKRLTYTPGRARAAVRGDCHPARRLPQRPAHRDPAHARACGGARARAADGAGSGARLLAGGLRFLFGDAGFGARPTAARAPQPFAVGDRPAKPAAASPPTRRLAETNGAQSTPTSWRAAEPRRTRRGARGLRARTAQT